jgi:hypothetical protein
VDINILIPLPAVKISRTPRMVQDLEGRTYLYYRKYWNIADGHTALLPRINTTESFLYIIFLAGVIQLAKVRHSKSAQMIRRTEDPGRQQRYIIHSFIYFIDTDI